jgi:hypothetical protein
VSSRQSDDARKEWDLADAVLGQLYEFRPERLMGGARRGPRTA